MLREALDLAAPLVTAFKHDLGDILVIWGEANAYRAVLGENDAFVRATLAHDDRRLQRLAFATKKAYLAAGQTGASVANEAICRTIATNLVKEAQR